MALADTRRAIGAVSKLLVARLMASGIVANVTVGRPEPAGSPTNPRLNLFLYELTIDASLRNTPLDEGQPAPLWLVLRYLLTAFDISGASDSADAHELLGSGMQVLNELNFFPLTGLAGDIVKALKHGPEYLKLTFDDASPELLAKIMQGTDEKYRCSAAFQIRPVLIAPSQPPEYSLLVGVDYTKNAVIGEAGVRIPVLPSMGPQLTGVTPEQFEAGATITLTGVDLNLKGLSVALGPAALPITSQAPDKLVCSVPASLGSGTAISAGTHPLAAVQTLPTGRQRSSNLLTADLLPVVATATLGGLARVGAPGSNVFGFVDIAGNLLGQASDDVYLAFYQNGKVVRMTDNAGLPPGPPPPAQTKVRFTLANANAIPPGSYTLIVRVNGQQARNSPVVNWVA